MEQSNLVYELFRISLEGRRQVDVLILRHYADTAYGYMDVLSTQVLGRTLDAFSGEVMCEQLRYVVPTPYPESYKIGCDPYNYQDMLKLTYNLIQESRDSLNENCHVVIDWNVRYDLSFVETATSRLLKQDKEKLPAISLISPTPMFKDSLWSEYPLLVIINAITDATGGRTIKVSDICRTSVWESLKKMQDAAETFIDSSRYNKKQLIKKFVANVGKTMSPTKVIRNV